MTRITSDQKKRLMRALHDSGLFVSCGKVKPNVMSTHWGALGNVWNKDVFILPVREGKLSHEVIEKEKSFAISVPKVDMTREIIACDHLSGYNVNKFDELRLHPKRARHISAYVLGEAGLIFECKVIMSAKGSACELDPELKRDMYNGRELHTIYFGEIIDCYEN